MKGPMHPAVRLPEGRELCNECGETFVVRPTRGTSYGASRETDTYRGDVDPIDPRCPACRRA